MNERKKLLQTTKFTGEQPATSYGNIIQYNHHFNVMASRKMYLPETQL